MGTWDTVDVSKVADALRWDAEFFVNPYNDFLNSLFARWHSWVSLSAASLKLTSGHTPLHHDVTQGDTPFITVECVDPLALNMRKAKRVWSDHARGELSRVCVRQGDVLITIKRRIAISSPVLADHGLMPVNQDVVVMTPKRNFRAGYIAAVLNSRIGQFQALRHATEQMNPYINVTTLGQLLIPLVPDSVQKRIEAAVNERLRLMEDSVSGFAIAEAELLERLGWEEVRRESIELSYVKDFVALTSAMRADAEFFQPQHNRLRVRLAKRGAQTIGSFCPKPSRGVQPLLVEDGELMVVDSKAVRPLGVEPAVGERTSRHFYNSARNIKGRLRRNDVLLNSTGRGTLGRAGWYQFDSPALCDNHVTILRPNSKVCHPVYLSLFLNSPAGLAQSEQFQSGSSGQLEIYPEHIQQFLIYVPRQKNGAVDIAWQKRLATKVEAASAAKVAARIQLEEAKRLVEDAISG